MMKDIFWNNKWFYLPYLFFLAVGAFILLYYRKFEIHWFINQHHHTIADYFFKYITNVGDGIVIAVAIAILLFIKYRYSLVIGISSIVATILVQVLKRNIFEESYRPVIYFEKMKKFYRVDGVDIHISNSFPSGHSATAFSIFLMFALISDNKYLKCVFFIIAFLVAYSRMYLSQHFLVDIYFGSLIGVFSTTLTYLWSKNWKSGSFDKSLQIYLKGKNNVN